jgi:hypothetical protein
VIPKDEACSSLKQTLLTPQQSKSTPTPSDAPNPIIADAMAMTMRIPKPKAKVCILCQCNSIDDLYSLSPVILHILFINW